MKSWKMENMKNSFWARVLEDVQKKSYNSRRVVIGVVGRFLAAG